MAGKDIVEVYFSALYSSGGIEKFAIELAGYAKTSLLKPGASETVTITFPTRDMSSYDMNVEQAYVLDAGEYQIYVSKYVHGSVDTLSYTVDETVIYNEDDATGTKILNQFDYTNGNLTYLSRDDWSGTYPSTADMDFVTPQNFVDNFSSHPPKIDRNHAHHRSV